MDQNQKLILSVFTSMENLVLIRIFNMKNMKTYFLHKTLVMSRSALCLYLFFSLTVKAATLIFISGRGLAISSAKQGKSGSIYNLVKNFMLFGPRKRKCIS